MMKPCAKATALLVWALLLGLAPQAARAQGVTTSAIRGSVATPAGEPLANVQIVVRNTATGLVRTGLTTADGRFFVPNLPPGGPYTVAASRTGYQTAERVGVRLVLNQTFEANLQLAEQTVALEGLVVQAQNNPVISPSRTGAATVIGTEQIEDIPAIDRNFTDLAVVSPHVYVTGESPSIGGSNNRFNNIQIDGAVNNDVFGLASSGVPGGQANAKPISIDAIQQFQVLIAPFDVRQTGFTGGLINAVTKSGTNSFRGSLYGYFRDEALTRNGELNTGAETLGPIQDFQRWQGGLSLGGPILRDKLFFFVNGEVERREIPTTFGIESDPADIRVLPRRVEEVVAGARQKGLEPGVSSIYNLNNPSTNLFGRLDYNINANNRMVLRHNFVSADDDDSPSRGGSTFELSSATYLFTSRTNSTVLQLFSQINERLSNEFSGNVQIVRDRRGVPGPFRYATTRVFTRDTIGGRLTSGAVRIGADFFSHANELDQDIVEVTDNLTFDLGIHRITAGVTGQYMHFRNLFFPGSLGSYDFNNTADFLAGRPSSYTISLPFPGRNTDDVAARFGVFQPGLYLQDEWSPNDALTVTLGVRADVPFMLDEPADNPEFQQQFNRSTTTVPNGNVLFSPRLGFNWQGGDLDRTQLRGGVGIFTGRPPFVWLSNAFSNTGRESVLLSCRGSKVPAYDPRNPPTVCSDGQGALAQGGAIVNVFDENFRFPQDLKFDLAVDRELPFGITATVEGIYSKALEQVFVRELNLAGPQNVAASATRGIGNRIIYGTPQADRDFGFNPVRVSNQFRNVVELTNNSEGYAYSLTGELTKTFFERFDLRGSYTYAQVKSALDLTSSIATSNLGFNPIGENLYERPVTSSVFERPHKVVLQGTTEFLPRFGGTRLAVLYVGQSGRPYSYTYDGDINGDGYQGPGLFGRNNDLLYVPTNLDEIAFQSPDDRILFEQLIEAEECLQNARGRILERNSCRGPWSNRLDLSVSQGLPFGRRGAFRPKLELNVFNFLNLLNDEWGLQEGPFNSTVTALDLNGRVNRNDPTSPMIFTYDGAVDRDTGRARRPLATFFDSRYQIQLGLRVAF